LEKKKNFKAIVGGNCYAYILEMSGHCLSKNSNLYLPHMTVDVKLTESRFCNLNYAFQGIMLSIIKKKFLGYAQPLFSNENLISQKKKKFANNYNKSYVHVFCSSIITKVKYQRCSIDYRAIEV